MGTRKKTRSKNSKKKKAKKPKELTKRQAQKLLERERQARVKAVEVGLQQLLAKHNCMMDIQLTLSGRRGVLGGQVAFVPRPDPPLNEGDLP